jgi:hypothetical protein
VVVLGIIGLFESIAHGILSLIPSPSVPGINSLATSVVAGGWFGHLGWVNDYLPLGEILTAFGVVLAVYTAMWVVRITLWLLEKFHVLGGD